jgi:hypothetical protein
LEKPTFAEISAEYIKMRSAADGDDHKDIQYLRLRRQTFLELIEDRPVDQVHRQGLARLPQRDAVLAC